MFDYRSIWEAQEIFNEYLLPRIKSLSRRVPESVYFTELEESRKTARDAQLRTIELQRDSENLLRKMDLQTKSLNKLSDEIPKLEQDHKDQKAYLTKLLSDKEQNIYELGYKVDKLTKEVSISHTQLEELSKLLKTEKKKYDKLEGAIMVSAIATILC